MLTGHVSGPRAFREEIGKNKTHKNSKIAIEINEESVPVDVRNYNKLFQVESFFSADMQYIKVAHEVLVGFIVQKLQGFLVFLAAGPMILVNLFGLTEQINSLTAE